MDENDGVLVVLVADNFGESVGFVCDLKLEILSEKYTQQHRTRNWQREQLGLCGAESMNLWEVLGMTEIGYLLKTICGVSVLRFRCG